MENQSFATHSTNDLNVGLKNCIVSMSPSGYTIF